MNANNQNTRETATTPNLSFPIGFYLRRAFSFYPLPTSTSHPRAFRLRNDNKPTLLRFDNTLFSSFSSSSTTSSRHRMRPLIPLHTSHPTSHAYAITTHLASVVA